MHEEDQKDPSQNYIMQPLFRLPTNVKNSRIVSSQPASNDKQKGIKARDQSVIF